MRRLLATSELFFGWPHLRGLNLGDGLVFPVNDILRWTFPGWWLRLSCHGGPERFLWLILYQRLQDKTDELTMCLEAGTKRARLLYRGESGEEEMELLPDGILPTAVERLLYRSHNKRVEDGVVRGEINMLKPRAVWAFDWSPELGRLHLLLVESEPLQLNPTGAETKG